MRRRRAGVVYRADVRADRDRDAVAGDRGLAGTCLCLALTLRERRHPGLKLRTDSLGRVDDELAPAAVHRDDRVVGNR